MSDWYSEMSTRTNKMSTRKNNTEEKPKEDPEFGGYISEIVVGGKIYKLKCEVVEAHPITCKKCGASFELKYGEGRCEHCGTYYTTKFELVEA